VSDLYDGPATIRIGDAERAVRVRLYGHVDPIDGRYHWQGTVFDSLPAGAKLPQPVTVSVGDGRAEARITEPTPWGTYSVAGVGAPPFALDDIEFAMPRSLPAAPRHDTGTRTRSSIGTCDSPTQNH
jgi:hypothetical protein